MADSLRPFTAGKWLLGLAGLALLASVSFGSWRLWSENADPATEAQQPVALPDPPPIVQAPPSPAPARSEVVLAVVTPPVVENDKEPAPQPTQPKEEPAPRKKEAIKGKEHMRPNEMLTSMMQQFHQEAYQHFISQPGGGFSRMIPTVQLVKREWKSPKWTSEELAKEQQTIYEKDLTSIHGLALMRFGASNALPSLPNPAAKVAKAPTKKATLWEIKSLDLVGLSMQEEPVVYISDKLPDMKDLKSRPTRAMDLFESEGLEELTNGKLLYIRSKDDTIRVLGPLHAGTACLKCHHDAKEGALLGMFSYTLRPGQYRSNIPQFGPGIRPNPGKVQP